MVICYVNRSVCILVFSTLLLKMKKIIVFGIILVAVFFAFDADAQCAMCKMVPGSDLEGGGKKALGLNKGILYLMGIPYTLFMVFLFIFRKSIIQKFKSFRNK